MQIDPTFKKKQKTHSAEKYIITVSTFKLFIRSNHMKKKNNVDFITAWIQFPFAIDKFCGIKWLMRAVIIDDSNDAFSAHHPRRGYLWYLLFYCTPYDITTRYVRACNVQLPSVRLILFCVFFCVAGRFRPCGVLWVNFSNKKHICVGDASTLWTSS